MAEMRKQVGPHHVVGGLLILLLVLIFSINGWIYYSKYSAAKTDINKITDTIKLFSAIDYNGPYVSLFNNYITLHNISITPHRGLGAATTIGSLSYQVAKDPNGKLLSLSLKVTDLHTALPHNKMDPNAAMALDLLNIQDLRTDFTIDYRYKPTVHALLLKFTQNFKGLCQIGLGIIINDFNPYAGNFAQNMTMQIKQVHFEYTDHSLISTLLNALAKQESMTKEQLLAGLELRLSAVMAKTNNPRYQAMLNTLIEFIKKPGTLVINANPEPTVTISELQMLQPDQIPERLNIEMTAKN